MRIDSNELQTLTLIVAKGRFRDGVFRRRDLMRVVEAVAKTLDLWTDEDDDESESAGKKSRGMAAIDWAVSNLKDNGLTHVAHDQWRVT
jgi:hypothetical protein